MTARILVVDDERAIQLALAGLIRKAGHEAVVATSAAEAIAALEHEPFALVLTDLALGEGQTGIDVIAAARASSRPTPVVLVTARGSEKVAVLAMKAGAFDYLPKPFDNDEMRLVIERALETGRITREHRLLLDRVARDQGLGAIVGCAPSMKRVFATIEKVAETDLTVLIRGPSGTGKELVAQALHQRSARSERPFVAVNCAAISRELVESELFGHEKGAFTGAGALRVGRFEAAHRGTIFLDEIGDMAPETQAKVLRVLEERSFERVGGATTVRVEVRVVCATHRDLEAEVKAGRFREDLYYRLRVVELVLPALADRIEDVPALAERFLGKLAERLSRPRIALSAPALARLCAHGWPGNVRELRNVVERAAVLAAGDTIEESDLGLGEAQRASSPAGEGAPPFGATPSFAEAKRRAIDAFERGYLRAALAKHGHNVSRTAEAIGMVRQSLQQKIRELGLRSTTDKDD